MAGNFSDQLLLPSNVSEEIDFATRMSNNSREKRRKRRTADVRKKIAKDPNIRGFIVNYLPPDVTTEDLRSLFSHYGEVVDARVMYTKNHNSRCFGFVTMARKCDAVAAYKKLNGLTIGKSRLRVQWATSGGSRCKVFVTGFPQNWDEDDLIDFYGVYGVDITEVNLLRRQDGQSRRCAFIRFLTSEQSRYVYELKHFVEIERCPVSMYYAVRPKTHKMFRHMRSCNKFAFASTLDPCAPEFVPRSQIPVERRPRAYEAPRRIAPQAFTDRTACFEDCGRYKNGCYFTGPQAYEAPTGRHPTGQGPAYSHPPYRGSDWNTPTAPPCLDEFSVFNNDVWSADFFRAEEPDFDLRRQDQLASPYTNSSRHVQPRWAREDALDRGIQNDPPYVKREASKPVGWIVKEEASKPVWAREDAVDRGMQNNPPYVKREASKPVGWIVKEEASKPVLTQAGPASFPAAVERRPHAKKEPRLKLRRVKKKDHPKPARDIAEPMSVRMPFERQHAKKQAFKPLVHARPMFLPEEEFPAHPTFSQPEPVSPLFVSNVNADRDSFEKLQRDIEQLRLTDQLEEPRFSYCRSPPRNRGSREPAHHGFDAGIANVEPMKISDAWKLKQAIQGGNMGREISARYMDSKFP